MQITTFGFESHISVIYFLVQSNRLTAEKLHDSFVAQVWGVSTLGVVLLICPLLGVLSKNAIGSIQVNTALPLTISTMILAVNYTNIQMNLICYIIE